MLSFSRSFYVVFYNEAALRYSMTYNMWQACNFVKKETLAQVFSRKFCEISKNTFSTW